MSKRSAPLPLAITGLQAPKMPYDQFLLSGLAKYVSGTNPNEGRKMFTEGLDLVTMDYNMWQAVPEHQEFLTMQPRDYVYQATAGNEFISRFFVEEESESEIHLLNRVVFSKDVAEMQARGTLVPLLTSTMEKSITRNTFHHQGFSLNYYTNDKIEGVEDRNFKMKMLAMNVLRTEIAAVVSAFLTTPHHYSHAYQKNSAYTLPETPTDLFLMEQKTFGIFNKSVTALSEIVRDANNIFAQLDDELHTTDVLMSFSDTFYIQKCNDIMVRADASGNVGAQSVHSLQLRRNFGDFVVTNIPFIQKDIQDSLNHTFSRPFATGSVVNFVNKAWSETDDYRTQMRNVYYADIKSGEMQLYTLIDHLENLPHFKESGELDYSMLAQFCKSHLSSEGGWMKKIGVRAANNENRLDPFLRAVSKVEFDKAKTDLSAGSSSSSSLVSEYVSFFNGLPQTGGAYRWIPHHVVGDIPEEQCREEYMERISASMMKVLFVGLTEEKKNKATGYEDLEIRKVVSQNLAKTSPVGYSYDQIITVIKAVEANPDAELKKLANENTTFRMLRGSLVPALNETRSVLVKRLIAASKYPLLEKIAAFCNLLTVVHMDNMRARALHNVHIPFGAMNVRHRETQQMHSVCCVALASGERAKLGTFYRSRGKIFSDFNAVTKMYDYAFETSHGAALINKEQFYWQLRVRGGPLIGGSDSYYADQRKIRANRSSYSTYVQAMLEHGSNLAVAASYNQSVEGTVLADFDIRGYFHAEDMEGKVAGDSWMNRNQDRPPADGLCMLNYLHDFDKNERREFKDIDIKKLNFNQEALMHQNNFIVRQLNSCYYDPVTKTVAMTDSHHLWGVLKTNVRAYVTSETNVVQEEYDEEDKRRMKRAKFDVFN